jgi:hypothetical protein
MNECSFCQPPGNYTITVETKMNSSDRLRNDRSANVSANPSRIIDDQALKVGDYTIDRVEDLTKCLSNGVFGYGIENSLLERYFKGVLAPHFHLWACSADGTIDFGDYCFVVKGALMEAQQRPEIGRMGELDFSMFGYGLGHREQLVFVSRIQLLKRPEGAWCSVRSYIRLQLAHLCDRVPMDSGEPGQSSLVESLKSQENREQRLAISEVATSQSPRDIIERTSSIVETVADDKRPVVLRNFLENIKPQEMLSLFRVEFRDNTIGIAIEKSGDFRIKRLRMFFGAAQLVPTFP